MKGFIPIVIPYLASDAQGRELELAVCGWRAHFMEQYRIYIVGDRHPIVDRGEDDIEFIECPRIQPVKGQYLPHLDIVNKFLKYFEQNPHTPGFVYACDDMYAVRDFTILDIATPKISEKEIAPFDWKKEGGWLGDIGKTRELCIGSGLPIMNWVCHLPVLYSRQLFDLILSSKNGTKESYVWENIFFNLMYNQDDEPRLVPPTGSKWKYEVKTSNPGISSTDEANAIWITNANCGWSKRLEDILWAHYREILPVNG